MSSGPVMLDVEGLSLCAEDKELLAHPAVGGVILFTRNYESPEQVEALVKEIHAARQGQILVAVDHEGGRVQRFRKGFTEMPAVRGLGELHDRDPAAARQLAFDSGWLMAIECRAVGIDISFAPVLDLDFGVSDVIGNRAFHRKPDVVVELAHAYINGMTDAGMAATGKHFPGHGAVVADSHLALPVDERSLNDILAEDGVPFERMSEYGMAGIMPAHVLYPQVDDKTAGFSKIWLQDILRKRMNFQGVIFSDDLNMAAADTGGSYAERAHLALDAGCDMVLVCNNRPAAIEVVDALKDHKDPVSALRRVRMHGQGHMTRKRLLKDERWVQVRDRVLSAAEQS